MRSCLRFGVMAAVLFLGIALPRVADASPIGNFSITVTTCDGYDISNGDPCGFSIFAVDNFTLAPGFVFDDVSVTYGLVNLLIPGSIDVYGGATADDYEFTGSATLRLAFGGVTYLGPTILDTNGYILIPGVSYPDIPGVSSPDVKLYGVEFSAADLTAVPEPSTLLLLGTSLACFGVVTRRRRAMHRPS